MSEDARDGTRNAPPEAGFAGREAHMTHERGEAVKEGARGGTMGSPTNGV
jgi:hypothetical protein